MAGCLCLSLPGLYVLLIAASLIHGQSCPQRCDCIPHQRAVMCQNKRLGSIPGGIPNDTRLLDLTGNSLRWVEYNDLATLSRLEELDFSENLISVLEPNAFSSLLNLRVLRLRANQLKLVPMGAFSRLTNLTTLDLSGNKLVILLDFTFQDLKNLRNLEVGDNELVYISNKAFLGLVGLRELTIERCNLTSITGQSLSYLRSLVTLRLRYLSIASLEEQNFRKLGGLRGLEIDHWPFLEYISPHSFQGLNLSWLSITNTNISTVPNWSPSQPNSLGKPQSVLQPHLSSWVLGLAASCPLEGTAPSWYKPAIGATLWSWRPATDTIAQLVKQWISDPRGGILPLGQHAGDIACRWQPSVLWLPPTVDPAAPEDTQLWQKVACLLHTRGTARKSTQYLLGLCSLWPFHLSAA